MGENDHNGKGKLEPINRGNYVVILLCEQEPYDTELCTYEYR